MQAHSFNKNVITAALVTFVAVALTACGGGDGEPSDSVVGLQAHSVSPTGEASTKVGFRLPISSYSETFGPSIASVEWDSVALADSTGSIEIQDANCARGNRSTRLIPNSDKVIDKWTCNTSAMPSVGAQGKFEITSYVVLVNGASKSASFVLSVK